MMAISVGFSFVSTVSTPIAQAYGAKEYRMCRVYLHRQYYLNTLVFIATCVPLIFIRLIYDLIGQKQKVAELAS